MVKVRRLPQDDYMHEPESASNFNESRYYNWFDHEAGMGGWVRMGNRVNEGYAELSVCLYLPDGRVGFMFKRPKIASNAEHDAGRAAVRGAEAVRGAPHHLRGQGVRPGASP